MKGKNKKNNDNKSARKPVVSEQFDDNEVLESAEGTPTDDFMEEPIPEPQKGVTLNDLADIDPELLTGKPTETAAVPDLPSLPESKNAKSAEPEVKHAPESLSPGFFTFSKSSARALPVTL